MEPTINDIVKNEREREMNKVEVIEQQGWCPEHWNYYYEDKGCETCNYEEESK